MSVNDKLKKQANMRIFFDKMRPKVISLLCNKYGLRAEEAADCFQEGAIAVWKNLRDGKITLEAVNSLESYLFRCCCNHATKVIRAQKDTDVVDDFMQFERTAEEQSDNLEDRERQIAILVSLVKQMDEPCYSIIWGFYRHKYSMEDMAAMLNYSSARVVITQKSRCMKKLKEFAKERGLINPQYA